MELFDSTSCSRYLNHIAAFIAARNIFTIVFYTTRDILSLSRSKTQSGNIYTENPFILRLNKYNLHKFRGKLIRNREDARLRERNRGRRKAFLTGSQITARIVTHVFTIREHGESTAIISFDGGIPERRRR